MSTGSLPGPCADAVENLYALLDRELTIEVRQRVQQHFEACVDCFPLYQFERSFSRFLKARSAALSAPADLRRKVFQALLLQRNESDGSANGTNGPHASGHAS